MEEESTWSLYSLANLYLSIRGSSGETNCSLQQAFFMMTYSLISAYI